MDLDMEPLGDGLVPARLCLNHCRGLLEQMEVLRELRPSEFTTGSMATLWFSYVAVLTLVPLLDREPDSHEPFCGFCGILFPLAAHWPAAAAVLKGVKALTRQLGAILPPDSLRFFRDGTDLAPDGDVPISWTVPQYSNLTERVSGGGDDVSGVSVGVINPVVDLGTIIMKWNALTIRP